MNALETVPMYSDKLIYTQVMENIRIRTDVINDVYSDKINMVYVFAKAEFIALQIRLIIESIALASLAVNKSLFEQENNKFKEWWNADKIFKAIENKNPDFYPQPFNRMPSNMPGVDSELIDLKEGFMTRDEILKVYGECCNILHASNPYNVKQDHNSFINQTPKWIGLIVNLLNSHKIKLLNDEALYIVNMRDESNNGVKMYYCPPAPN